MNLENSDQRTVHQTEKIPIKIDAEGSTQFDFSILKGNKETKKNELENKTSVTFKNLQLKNYHCL